MSSVAGHSAVSLGAAHLPGGKQVRVAEQDDRAPYRPSSSRRPWTVAWAGLALAVPVALWALVPGAQPPDVPVLLAVFVGLVAAESFNVQFEFRKQGFSWSPSELAFVMALVAVGGAWTAVAWAVAVAVVSLVQGYPRHKAVFNASVVVLEVCAAVGVLRVLPAGSIAEPATWLSYLVAVLAASMLVAALITAASSATQGYPGRTLWASLFVPVVLVGPVSVVVGLAVLLLVSVTPWAWALITPLLVALALLYRRFGAVTREGHSVERVYDFARRVEQVPPDEAGTRQIVQAVRDLLNAERVALWLPPYLDEEPRLVVSAENGAVWYDGPGDPDDVFRRRAVAGGDGPILMSLARADDEEAAALARRGVSDLLGAAVITAAGEPGYLEVCDRRSDTVSFADSDRAAIAALSWSAGAGTSSYGSSR